MITLTSISHTLMVSSSSTAALDVCVFYEDINRAKGGVLLGDEQSKIAEIGTNTILSAPSRAVQRHVRCISLNNTSLDSNTVVVKKNVSGTNYDIIGPITLGSNERIEYIDGQGWKVFSNTGALKTSLNQGASAINSSLSSVILANDVINNNAVANTIADVTGLSFPVVAGKTYYFKFVIPFASAATTTGSRWSINGPTFSSLCYTSEYTLAATTSTRNANVISYDMPVASNTGCAGTTSGNMCTMQGIITPSSDGILIARFASEISGSAITAKSGAVVYYQELR